MRVLQANQTGSREVVIRRAYRRSYVAEVQPAVTVVSDRRKNQPTQGRGPPQLEVQGVREPPRDHLLAAPAVSEYCGQVALRTARHPQCGFFAKHLGGRLP